MKRLSRWLFSLPPLLLCACVGDAGIYIAASHPLNEDCMSDTSMIRTTGVLDVSAQEDMPAPTYLLGLSLRNDLDGDDSDTVGAQRNLFYLKKISLKTSVGNAEISEEMDASGACTPGGGELIGSFNILSPKAYQKMLQLAGPELQSAVVSVKFEGKLLSGASYTTNAYDFPINFYASGMAPISACGEGEVLKVQSGSECPAVPLGQDGTTAACVPASEAEEGN